MRTRAANEKSVFFCRYRIVERVIRRAVPTEWTLSSRAERETAIIRRHRRVNRFLHVSTIFPFVLCLRLLRTRSDGFSVFDGSNRSLRDFAGYSNGTATRTFTAPSVRNG